MNNSVKDGPPSPKPGVTEEGPNAVLFNSIKIQNRVRSPIS
jgi:hypothetical protein